MLSNLQEIKDLVSIRAVADYLGLEEEYGKRKFPGERTASIQLYKDNRFHDFGRNVDGDIFDLMIHVRGYTLKEAIAELKTAFNIKDSPVWENTVKEAWIAYLERKFNAKYIEHYDYFLIDQSGKAVYAYTKVRLQDKAGKKKLIYGMFNSDRFILGLQGKKAKDIPAIYGSSVFKIQEAIDRQETIFYVEGEKDVNTLMKKGYTVFTCGGSGDWKPDASILFQNANVIVLADNDEPGKKLASNVMKDLKGITRSIKVIVPMPDVTKADITDYFEAGHTVEEFENLIKTVDDTEEIYTDVQQNQKQDAGRKQTVTQKNKDEVTGVQALVFRLLDCNYDENGNVKSVKQLVHNFEVVMDKDNRFSGKIRFNEFAQQLYLYGSVPWKMRIIAEHGAVMMILHYFLLYKLIMGLKADRTLPMH